MTRYYLIANRDLGAEFAGAVIGNCEPVEAMRTMVAIVNEVSRETVNLAESRDRQGWVWWIESTPHNGTARFLTADEASVNPWDQLKGFGR